MGGGRKNRKPRPQHEKKRRREGQKKIGKEGKKIGSGLPIAVGRGRVPSRVQVVSEPIQHQRGSLGHTASARL